MQDIYVYLILGIVLGIGITMYVYETYKEWVYNNTAKYMSTRMVQALLVARKKMLEKIVEVKRELTDEEKDQIIQNCYYDETTNRIK